MKIRGLGDGSHPEAEVFFCETTVLHIMFASQQTTVVAVTG